MDRALGSPHRLAVFEGTHVWLSSELAMQAVEWMEIQAAKAGTRVDVEPIYAKRVAAIAKLPAGKERYLALEAMAAGFAGLKDVSQFAEEAAALGRDKHVRQALKKEVEEEELEHREIDAILRAEVRLKTPDQHGDALNELRNAWKRLSAMAGGPVDSAERRMARRVVRGLSMSAGDRGADAEYLKVLEAYRMPR